MYSDSHITLLPIPLPNSLAKCTHMATHEHTHTSPIHILIHTPTHITPTYAYTHAHTHTHTYRASTEMIIHMPTYAFTHICSHTSTQLLHLHTNHAHIPTYRVSAGHSNLLNHLLGKHVHNHCVISLDISTIALEPFFYLRNTRLYTFVQRNSPLFCSLNTNLYHVNSFSVCLRSLM